MGTGGGSHPQEMVRRHARTLFLRAPYQEWAALTTGFKTEFRLPHSGRIMPVAPTPVVLYSISPSKKDRKSKVMVLVEVREEALYEISTNHRSLLGENCATYDDFRRYWRARTHREYRPSARVEVYRLAFWPTNPLALDQLGRTLLTRLYGDYLDQ